MKRDRKSIFDSLLTNVKSRKSSSESSDSSADEKPSIEPVKSKGIKSTPKQNKSHTDVTVRLHNADMLTKYKNKNPHLVIEKPKTTTNCLPNELDDDDEVWLCEIPNIVDVNELVGKSIKLGSKKCFVKTEDGLIECSSEKYESDPVYQNTISIVFQKNDAQLAIKNVKPTGRLTFRAKANELIDNPLENAPQTKPHQSTLFPTNLVSRHPLHGRQFEDSIKVKKSIQKKLKIAEEASMQKATETKIKTEKDADITDEVVPTTKKSKKRRADSQSNAEVEPKKSRTEIKIENDDDLSWIKSL